MYFKELSYRTKNRINMCKTLANRHEYFQAWIRAKDSFLVRNTIEHSYGKLTPTRIMQKHIQELLLPLLGDQEAVYTVRKAQCSGTWYEEGCAVVVGATSEGFVSFAIVELCCLIGGQLFLICNIAKTTNYIHHLHAYSVSTMHTYVLKRISELLDHYPLSVYSRERDKLVALRHHIFQR